MAKPITFVKRSKDTNPPARPQVHRYPELAQLFATTFVAYLMDVRFQTALKRYGHTPASTYWLDLADRVCADYGASPLGGDFQPRLPTTPVDKSGNGRKKAEFSGHRSAGKSGNPRPKKARN
jgi:cyanate lyase